MHEISIIKTSVDMYLKPMYKLIQKNKSVLTLLASSTKTILKFTLYVKLILRDLRLMIYDLLSIYVRPNGVSEEMGVKPAVGFFCT